MAYAQRPPTPRASPTPRNPVRLRRRLTRLRDRLTDELGPLDAPPLDDVLAAFRAFRPGGPGRRHSSMTTRSS
ncbi:hypothetical protein GCM10022225_10200 [Plantactinospora mayteni]|uniref:Uncharacterized protein n=1 Tax=Plantactinospora mayteni TaxID=566021 RepID=A0ABQ4EJ24_9ACTN|nr:hypothetical protein [Plantactinospora mayteni]GIG94231.1 hypothetical protein Pma05_08040 [Plantactinospora mayteni]